MNQPVGALQPEITRRQKAGPQDFVPKEDYVGRDFARLEQQRLWPRAWQMACREEEIPRVGVYVTSDVPDESVIVPWGLILEQDFANMTELQRGMRSMGFAGSRTNPIQERSVSNFHNALREFVGA